VHLFSQFIVNPLLPPEYHNTVYWPTHMFCCFLFLCISGIIFYLSLAGGSYYFFFVRGKKNYFPTTLPEDISKQVKHEISIALRHIPGMAVITAPVAFGITRGYSKIYYSVDEYGWVYFFFSIPSFLFFTDMLIYYIHRGLHWGPLYKYIHKTHHTYRYTTPFSSHAFHFLDGTAQACPYFIFVYLFPMHDILFGIMFFFVNAWTISIHDQVDFSGQLSFINSTGHHTIHHTEFNYNYGQYFTLWDRINGTHRDGTQTHDFWKGKRLISSEGKPTVIARSSSGRKIS